MKTKFFFFICLMVFLNVSNVFAQHKDETYKSREDAITWLNHTFDHALLDHTDGTDNHIEATFKILPSGKSQYVKRDKLNTILEG